MPEGTPRVEGRVVAVCRSDSGNVPKYPKESIVIGEFGIEGDYHAGPTRTKKTGEVVPNNRQVTLVAREAIDALERELGCSIPVGGFGENVLVEGLGDLAQLAEGDVVELGDGARLEITGQNNPCTNLQVWHPDMVKAAYGRRGVMAVVIRTGVVRPGDRIAVTERAAVNRA